MNKAFQLKTRQNDDSSDDSMYETDSIPFIPPVHSVEKVNPLSLKPDESVHCEDNVSSNSKFNLKLLHPNSESLVKLIPKEYTNVR